MPNFPTSLDALANPTATTLRNDPGFELHSVISTLNDIAEALEAKLGIGASTPGATAGVLRRTATGASAWGPLLAGDYGSGSVANADLAGTISLSKLQSVVANYVVRGDGSGLMGSGLLTAANMTPGAMPQQINSATLGSPGVISFTSIPQTYQHLLLLVVARSSNTVTSPPFDTLYAQLNGDGASNYFGGRIYGSGAAAQYIEQVGTTYLTVGMVPNRGAPSLSYQNAAVLFIPGYASTSGFKTILALNGAFWGPSSGLNAGQVTVGTWAKAPLEAVTQIAVKPLLTPFTFDAGAVGTLYGLN